jgi:hypothetical protein
MLVSGIKKGYIGALIGGNKLIVLERNADDRVFNKIISASAKFWESIDKNIEPEPNFEMDAEFIIGLHKTVNPETILAADGEVDKLAKEYSEFAKKESDAKKEKEILKAKLLTIIGEHEKVIGSNYSISCGVVGPAEVSFKREAYRNFKVTFKKEKIK